MVLFIWLVALLNDEFGILRTSEVEVYFSVQKGCEIREAYLGPALLRFDRGTARAWTVKGRHHFRAVANGKQLVADLDISMESYFYVDCDRLQVFSSHGP